MVEPGTHEYGLDDPRVLRFARDVGPQVRDYLRDKYQDIPVSLSPLGTGGKYFGLRLKGYLDGEGVKTRLIEIDSLDRIKIELQRHEHDIRGTVFIGVDDAIWTATTYNRWKTILDELREELGIIDVKFAVEHDSRKIADWYCENDSSV